MTRSPGALTRRGRRAALLQSGGVLAAALVLGASAGPEGLHFPAALPEEAQALWLQLRVPRVWLALLTGSALAASGAALQALLRNPLADPYIIGVSGGAAVGGSIVLASGALSASSTVAFGGVTGALMTFLALSLLLSRGGPERPADALLLGVVFNAFAASLLTLLKTWMPAERAYALMSWLVGRIDYLAPPSLVLLTGVVALALLLLIRLAGHLEMLSLGDDEAARLGVPVRRCRLLAWAACSALVGVLVPFTGMIGFVGLITPHALRLVWGPDQRLLLPASALMGGALLVSFDAASRLAFPFLQAELPVGALAAFVGAPFFGYAILTRHRHGGGDP